jgi:hypothetical protein
MSLALNEGRSSVSTESSSSGTDGSDGQTKISQALNPVQSAAATLNAILLQNSKVVSRSGNADNLVSNQNNFSESQRSSFAEGSDRESFDGKTILSKGSSATFFSGALSILGQSTNSNSSESAVLEDSANRHSNSFSPMTSSSIGMISSIFSSTPGSKEKTVPSGGLLNDQLQTDSGDTERTLNFDESESEQNKEIDEHGRLPSAMRLMCLRCSGTVEGPKFSTCKCSTPAITAEDLNSSAAKVASSAVNGMFSGMLSKGSYVAGGIAGGLYKATSATTHTMGGLISGGYSITGHNTGTGNANIGTMNSSEESAKISSLHIIDNPPTTVVVDSAMNFVPKLTFQDD